MTIFNDSPLMHTYPPSPTQLQKRLPTTGISMHDLPNLSLAHVHHPYHLPHCFQNDGGSDCLAGTLPDIQSYLLADCHSNSSGHNKGSAETILMDLSPPSSIYSEGQSTDSTATSSPLLLSPPFGQHSAALEAQRMSLSIRSAPKTRPLPKQLDFDAPIKPRTYHVASKTARKAVPQEFEHRAAAILKTRGAPIEPDESQLEEVAPDIARDIKDKRMRNTLSARRSRENKRAHVNKLQEEICSQQVLIDSLSFELRAYRTRFGALPP